jgi:hypothetical protein
MSKSKRPPIPEGFTRDERIAIGKWFRERWPHHFIEASTRKSYLSDQADEFLDYCRSENRQYYNYASALRNSIRRNMERRGYEPHVPMSSTPSPHGKLPFERQTEMENVAPLFAIEGGKK